MPVSERPWGDVSAADFRNPNAYCGACLIDQNEGEKSKALCKLPIREPGGAINRAACHAAAAALAGGRGGVDASPAEKQAAARTLVAIYRRDLDEEPPESLLKLAGSSGD